MKQNEHSEIGEGINKNNFANLFNVYQDESIDNAFSYAINRTINISGLLDDASDDYTNNIFLYHTIANSDTWKLISFRAYGTIDLWWLVCKVNKVIDPSSMPETGTVIRILESTYVTQVISDMRDS